MKKFIAVFIASVLAALPSLAQEFELTGEVKTGMYWESKQEGDKTPITHGEVHNNDDAGGNQGRFRLNLHYINGNVGMKFRFQEVTWGNETMKWSEPFPYAFAYGNFLDDQLKISAGKLGDSPWSMGGPEKWDELDTRIGIRTEIKPVFVPGLNIGFVLNDCNNGSPVKTDQSLVEVLQESVLGVSYDHDYFAFRFAYRFDSPEDGLNQPWTDEGAEFIYRVEERVLKNMLAGLQVWANGHYKGINFDRADGEEDLFETTNWLYAEYAPAAFTAQVRLGYDTFASRQVMHARGSFYYNVLSFLSAGVSAYYAQDYGTKYSEDSAFYQWNVEPKIKASFNGMYTELVYHYGSTYIRQDVEEKTSWINLRLVYTF
jgi:hypothetical protein